MASVRSRALGRAAAAARRAALIGACVAFVLGGVFASNPAVAAAAVHYVSPTGSATYASATNPATPCSLATAASGAVAGDTISLRGGTYSGRLTFSRSGAAGSPITIAAYSGEKPTIPGITLTGSYVTLSGLTVTGHTGNGIQAYGPHHVQLMDCEIHHQASGTVGSDAGIYLRDGHDLLVSGCYVHDIGVTCIRMIDCSAAVASGNVLADGAEDGFSVYGTNITIEGNRVMRCNSQTNHGDGIVVQAPWSKTYGNDTTGVVIRNNDVTDCSQYIYIDSWGQVGCNINGVLIYNNVLHAPSTTQYQTGIPFDAERGNISNVNTYNNTFVSFASAGSGGSAAVRWVTRAGSYSNFTLRNNLFVNSRIERDSGPSISNLSMDYGLFYNPGGSIIKWNGTSYNTLTSFRSAQPTVESHGVQGNPALTGDYRLQSGSAGQVAGIGPLVDDRVPTTDAAGVARTGASASMGAYEYASAPAPADTTPPIVSLTSPSNGAAVSGAVSLAASASDSVGVAGVAFRVDGALVASDTAAPFSATWSASESSVGTHTITAIAYDAAGNTAASSVDVVVSAVVPEPPADTTPPGPVTSLVATRTAGVTLSWVNPAASDFAGVRVLRSSTGHAATAADSSGQSVVYEGAGNACSDASAPSGTVYYSVFARDATGNWSSRAAATVAATQPQPVASLPTTLTLRATATKVVAGGSVTLRGTLVAGGLPATGRTDIVLWKRTGSVWSRVGYVAYNASTGYYQISCTQRSRTVYQMRFSGDASSTPKLLACSSNTVEVGVSKTVSRVSISKASVKSGTRVKLSVATQAPPESSVKVKAYRLQGKRWKYRGTFTMRAKTADATLMRYGATVKLGKRGLWRFAAVVSAEQEVAVGPLSKKLRVR